MKNLTILTALLTCASAMNAQSTFRSSLPVKPGKGVTVAGTVECDGKPVAGVVVSDGYELTKTDKKGAYYLKSKKQNPQVFITSPSGYDVYRDDVVPQFWADFTLPADKYERHDFRLTENDNSRHATIIITDVHLANQRNDVSIFSGPYTDVIRRNVESLNAQGIPVYTLNLGDASWDGYWYGHNYPIAKFRESLNNADYPTAVYSCMGNHDNDPKAQPGPDADFNASLPYQKALGPRYYSQNIGNVHYVFLDNIHYINDPAPAPTYTGINNKRNYKEDFTPEQLAWLRKDLANVSYDTPIIVAMHGPMFRWKKFDHKKNWSALNDEIMIRTDNESTRELLDILRPYKNVHSVSGHSHKQNLIRLPEEIQNFTEHNISGTCGAWWRTRATGLKNLCPDGTPVAYELFNIDGSNISWEHKTFDERREGLFQKQRGDARIPHHVSRMDRLQRPSRQLHICQSLGLGSGRETEDYRKRQGTSRGDGQGGKSSVHVVLHGAHDCLEQRMEQQGLSQSAQVHAFPRKSLYSRRAGRNKLDRLFRQRDKIDPGASRCIQS